MFERIKYFSNTPMVCMWCTGKNAEKLFSIWLGHTIINKEIVGINLAFLCDRCIKQAPKWTCQNCGIKYSDNVWYAKNGQLYCAACKHSRNISFETLLKRARKEE